MAFDYSLLTPYVQQNTDLIAESILNTSELSHVSVRTGVSVGTTTINVFSADFTDAERACTFADGNDVTFDQLPIVVGDRQLKSTFCPVLAREFWLSERMTPGANQEALPFEEAIAGYLLKGVSKNISDFIGGEIATQIGGSAPTYAGAAVLNVGNALEQLNDLYDALADDVKMMDDVKIWMSPANYRTAVRAIVAQNGSGFYHYSVGEGQGQVYLPGTNALLVQSSGFVGLDTIVAAPSKFIIFATGLMDDMDKLNIFYDQGEDIIKMSAYYRRGLGVYSVNKCASNGL